MKVLYPYLVLLSILLISLVTGGVESPVRFLYYPALIVFLAQIKPEAHFHAGLAFSILYTLMPLTMKEEYPLYLVAINVLPFLLASLVSGRISAVIQHDAESLRKSTDSYHGITNALSIKIMNLQSELDSLSEACNSTKESDRNKTRFISNVSHEIRAPLSSIRSFSEILLTYDDIDEDTKKEFLCIINKESERLTELSNDILDVVKIESGRIEWHMDVVDMKDVIQSAVKTMAPLAKDKGLLLETQIPDEISLVRGDRNKLLQVLLNLLSNALKFTAQGKVTIGVEEMPDEIQVSVSDTGEGIYPEEKEKIFEEFYRIGDNLTGRPKGSGLGLNISKRIIEANGGRIWVESELQKGSTFYFALPKETTTVGLQLTRPIAEMAGKQLLIMEDYIPIRQVLRSSLEELGFKTYGAESMKMALDIMKLTKPNAVILGYPESGDYFNELRTFANSQGIPIFLVSVITDKKNIPQVAVNGYLSRPFDVTQVTATVEEILHKKTGRFLIISDDAEEARDFQFLVGIRGYETEIASSTGPFTGTKIPDIIIIGSLQKERVYKIIELLREDGLTQNIPLILSMNMFMMDLYPIGLGTSRYGSGLDKLLESMEERMRRA